MEARFGGMLNAFRYGAPPHGGSAPGIDRIVMMLADERNIREVIAFPMNQQAQDLLMQAPSEVDPAAAARAAHQARPAARARLSRARRDILSRGGRHLTQATTVTRRLAASRLAPTS